MGNPVSLPVVPAIPGESSYPPASLNLFKEYDRASYKAAFGIDPPTYDGTKPTKGWFDTSGSSGYKAFVNRGGAVTYEAVDMKGMRPDEVNIFGLHSYPAYVVAPTQATYGIGGMPVNPAYLLDEKTANELAWALDAKDQVSISDGQGGPYQIVYPADEARRFCMIKVKGQLLVAGLLYQERHAAGFDAPGRWDLTGAEPNWISEIVTSLAPPNPPIPVPQRPLANNEAISVTPFGFSIYKKGAGSVLEPGNTSGGGFTADDRAILKQIATNTTK